MKIYRKVRHNVVIFTFLDTYREAYAVNLN